MIYVPQPSAGFALAQVGSSALSSLKSTLSSVDGKMGTLEQSLQAVAPVARENNLRKTRGNVDKNVEKPWEIRKNT